MKQFTLRANRIVVYTIVGFLTFSWLLQTRVNGSKTVIATPGSVEVVLIDRNDPRAFQPRSAGETFRIAWVGGSEFDTETGLLPIFLTEQVQTIGGKPISIDAYLVQGMRTTDDYMAIRSAIDSKPDAIIFSLNPIWLFNSAAAQGWQQSSPELLRVSVSDPKGIKRAILFSNPWDVLMTTFAPTSNIVTDRFAFSNALRNKAETFWPDGLRLTGENSTTSKLANLRDDRSPVEFWMAEKNGLGLNEYWTGSSTNIQTVRDMFAALESSNVPAYVYLGQLNPDYLEQNSEAVTEVETQLASIVSQSENTYFQTDILNDYLPLEVTLFKDNVHFLDGEPAGTFISQIFCEQVVRQRLSLECNK